MELAADLGRPGEPRRRGLTRRSAHGARAPDPQPQSRRAEDRKRRFRGPRRRATHALEWLSDNGSAYIARETAQTATALGLHLAFTPVRSPESNGISEAFVKTLKRDYARVTLLPDAETVMRLLPSWIEDYNTVHPTQGCASYPSGSSSP